MSLSSFLIKKDSHSSSQQVQDATPRSLSKKRKRPHAPVKPEVSITYGSTIDLTDADEGENGATGRQEDTPVLTLSDSDDGFEFVKTVISDSKEQKIPAKTINDVLRDATSSVHNTIPTKSLPPLLLSTPEQVRKHVPCDLIRDILPPSLAASLFRQMLKESQTWERNRWYLADRQVESPHTTCFYSAKKADNTDADNATKEEEVETSHWYMGRKAYDEKPREFLDEMSLARDIIEKRVNDMLQTKERQPMEYGGKWAANVAAANCYRGGAETVGAHADQLTYLGPFPTIASLSLGCTRLFRLRAVSSARGSAAPARTYDVSLPHNSLCVMGAGTQERFKHSVPPQRSIDIFKLKKEHSEDGFDTFVERINITFRFYRPDFSPSTTPICHCGIPCVLRADAKGKVALQQQSTKADASGSNDEMRFFWQCIAGAQNEGKRCNYFKILDMAGEGRGPCFGRPAI